MMRLISKPMIRTTLAILCIAVVPYASSVAMAQSFPQTQQQLLTPEQLDSLVAPIALYPDPLLSQVLAASTYPLEIVEAQQWLQQNRDLSTQQLVEGAKQQNWDPSVQLLVAFPDVMALVTRDIRWTTDLGNAFLTQQADVMNAIQQLRSEASDNGRLRSTPQQIVSTETENDESAIQIEPADPQMIYPPVYNPSYVWGPQVAGAYPAFSDPRAFSYPQGDYDSQGDYGSGFGSGTDIGGLFSGLLGAAGTIGSGLVGSGFGLGGWGWVLNWFTHSLFQNGSFLNGLGFGGSGFNNYGGGFNGGGVWAHNPAHRLGVPYSNGFVSTRYRGGEFGGHSGSWRSGFAGSGRSGFDGWHRPGFNSSAAGAYRSGFAGRGSGSRENYRGYASANVMPQRMGSNFRGSAGFDRAPERMGSNFRGSAGFDRAPERMGSSFRGSAGFGRAPQQMGSNFRGSAGFDRAPERMGSNFRGSAGFDRAPQRSGSNFRGSAAFDRASQRPAAEHFNFRNSPSTQRFSAPRESSSHFSAPRSSAPRGSSHFSGHSGGGRSGGGHSGKGPRRR